MRPDGTRVKDIPPIVAAIPYIMPKRYDAQNTITEYIDEELVNLYPGKTPRRRPHQPYGAADCRLLPGGPV